MRRLSVGLIGLSLFAAGPLRQRPQLTTTEHAILAPGGTVRIENSYGDVSVEGWDRPEVELTAIRSQPGLYGERERARLTQNLEKVRVRMELKSAGELVISTQFPSRSGLVFAPLPPKTRVGVELEYRLRVPRDAHLVIHHKDGQVLITDVSGEIEATARSGDIVAMLPEAGHYAIDAKAKVGTVYSDFGDAKHLDYLLGERFAAGEGRRIYLRTGVGGISIQRLGALQPAAATQSR
jgi:hypothetical protein